MQKITHIFLIFVFVQNCYAAGDNYALGARSSGMANASVTLSDLWSIHHNQAGLANIQTITTGIYYQNRFGLNELGVQGFAMALPIQEVSKGVVGVSVTYFGYSQYNDSKIGLAYSKQLGKKYSVGLQLDYLQTRLGGEYGSRAAFAGELGIRAKLLSNLNLGVHIYNPTRSKISEFTLQETVFTERIPTIMRAGLSYKFSEQLLLAIEVEKDVYYSPIFKMGIEYRPVNQLYLRGGLATDPVYNTFGFGLYIKNFKLDFSASKHQILGYTSEISLIYGFGKQDK